MKAKHFIWILFLVLFSVFAFARSGGVHFVTYEFDVDFYGQNTVSDVSVKAFTCLDSNCANLGAFPNTIIDSNNQDNKVIVPYPSTMASQNGYALFFTAPGYIPIEYHSTNDAGNGFSTVKASQNQDFQFRKVTVCTADVSNLVIDVAGDPNTPVIINSTAGMSASTKSAFNSINNGIIGVPSSLFDYYSALTDMKISIKNSTDDEVYSDTKIDQIFMDEVWSPSWSWTPGTAGLYTVSITSDVRDNKCMASVESSAAQGFEVFDSQPGNGVCFALINGLQITNNKVFSGENVNFEFDWSSFYVDSNGNNPTYLTFDWEILNSSDNVVSSGSVPSFPAAEKPKTYAVTAPSITDNYEEFTLKIVASPSSPLCNGNSHSSTQYIDFIVWTGESNKYDLTFNVLEQAGATNLPLKNALVELDSNFDNYDEDKTTDANGKVTFEDLDAGEYTYTISHNRTIPAKLKTKVGIVDVDRTKTITLTLVEDTKTVGNEAPVIYLDNSYKLVDQTNITIDLDDFVYDDYDAPENLVWTIPGTDSYSGTFVDVTIVNRVATVTAKATGNESVKFTVKDTENAASSKNVVFEIER